MMVNRRTFMVSTAAAMGAGMAVLSGHAARGGKARLSQKEIDNDQELSEVARFVSEYGDHLAFRPQSSRHPKARRAFVVRARTTVDRLTARFKKGDLPFDRIVCDGNNMTFFHGKTLFTIENRV